MQTDPKGNGRRGLTSFNHHAIQEAGNDSILTKCMSGGNKKITDTPGDHAAFLLFPNHALLHDDRGSPRRNNPLLCPNLLTRIVCAYWQDFGGRPCIKFDYISLPKTKMVPFTVLDRKPIVIMYCCTTGSS